MQSIDLNRRHAMAALAASAVGATLPSRTLAQQAQQPLPPIIKLVVGYSAGASSRAAPSTGPPAE